MRSTGWTAFGTSALAATTPGESYRSVCSLLSCPCILLSQESALPVPASQSLPCSQNLPKPVWIVTSSGDILIDSFRVFVCLIGISCLADRVQTSINLRAHKDGNMIGLVWVQALEVRAKIFVAAASASGYQLVIVVDADAKTPQASKMHPR